ncbi:MAG TPA: histidine phosphotransferase, partial [Rhodobacteraceae bacterium]|nr:histidine phosphotransferase [Paracoccaceae bacterium]
MIQSASHLASLIGSRICHDLISPIGAIHNRLELISLSGPVQHEAEISLITQSCQNAASRIKFFRVAFGVSGTDRQLSTDTLLDILMPLINGPRQNLHWKIH